MRKLFFLIILILSLLIVKFNYELHSKTLTNKEERKEILQQLNFLEKQLKEKDLAIRMQNVFPEGYVFINALYGLSWCELIAADTILNENLKNKAIQEALFAYDEINSDKARWTFNEELNPEYGIFYIGWKNYLLSKILTIDSTKYLSTKYIDEFKVQSQQIYNAMNSSSVPYLESYENQSWPADMFVAVASLSNQKNLLDVKYKILLDKWLIDVKNHLDPTTQMIPHKVNSITNEVINGARGCSMALILRMLKEIDPEFAKDQFQLFKENFITKTFGLPSVREFPKGQKGSGDIDSGPVIYGVGFTSTIVTSGLLPLYGYSYLGNNQLKTINAFGFTRKTKSEFKYLYGLLPMADAFIVWGKASSINYQSDISENSNNWRLKFHLLSLAIILFLWSLYFLRQLFNRIKNIKAKR